MSRRGIFRQLHLELDTVLGKMREPEREQETVGLRVEEPQTEPIEDTEDQPGSVASQSEKPH